MGSGLSRNRAGRPFSWRLSGNTWLFWVVCSCERMGKSMRGVGDVQVSARGEDVMEIDEGRAFGNGGTKRRRKVRWDEGSAASGLVQASPSPPAGAIPLTTTWLQNTVDSFTHTASKISSCPKLHSRDALCGKQGGQIGRVRSAPTALHLPSGHHRLLPWTKGLVLLSGLCLGRALLQNVLFCLDVQCLKEARST